MTAVDRPDNGQDELDCAEVDLTVALAQSDPEATADAAERLLAALATARAGAGEQQREWVAAELARHQHLMGRRDDDQPQWFSWCECGWEGGPVEPSRGAPADVRLAFRLHVAGEPGTLGSRMTHECGWPHLAPLTKMGRPVVDGAFMHVVGNFSGVAAAREAMGIDWMVRDELRESIPPLFTYHLGRQLMTAIRIEAVAA